jgi:hypoxanthine phosphoribosyltransferase
MSKKEKLFLSWGDVDNLIEDLCQKIELTRPPHIIEYITGLPRGGLIPAVMVSHKMGIPFIEVETLDPITWWKKKNYSILVVDDICDSGKTLQYFHPYYTTATLHYKPEVSSITPHIYCESVTKDEWIVYPWEREDSKMIPDYVK